jgi:Xaa-Pro aminopeptidase
MTRESKVLKKASRQGSFVERRRKLLSGIRSIGADAMLVTNPVEVSYLTGFTGEDSFLVVGRAGTCLVTDGRFTEQAGKECGPGIECRIRKGSIEDATAEVIRGVGDVKKVAFDPRHVTVRLKTDLSARLRGVKFVEGDSLVCKLRQIKDEFELSAMHRAIRVAQQAFKELCGLGAKGWIGRTEQDLAAELEYRMRKAGADGLAFPTILAAGAHGSVPHYCPASTRVKADQAVLVDWGARVGGYCSDLTRVVFTGTIPPKIREIYEIVRRAQAAGIAAMKPGVACKAVDAAARAVIEQAGYGDCFGHGLGHGLGRLVHENPRLSKISPDRLGAGMVITVEPGIYLPGVGGVRIEDDILVTATSSRRLTSLPRDLDAMRL